LLSEIQEFATYTYNQPEIHIDADFISGTETERSEEYKYLLTDIEWII